MDVFASGFYGIMGLVPFHATIILNAERPVLETLSAPSRQLEGQMTTCNNSSKYSTDSQNWEYPTSLKLYSFSPMNGGAL